MGGSLGSSVEDLCAAEAGDHGLQVAVDLAGCGACCPVVRIGVAVYALSCLG
jgi:hypothetical protein